MKRGGWATDEHLLRQHSKNSVIRTSVLRKMGVGAKTIVDRTAGGPWQRILPGLVLLHNGPPTWTQRVTAAVMYGGGEAMLTGRAGLALHGYSTSAHHSQTMLLIPHGSHRKDTSFVSVERTWRLPGAVRKSGLSVAPLDRCLLDAARRTVDEKACTALIAEVVQRGDADVVSLLTELNEGCGRGSAVPRRVLRDLGAGAHSVAELEAQKLYARSGLPPMVHNWNVYADDGKLIGCFDNWLDPVGFVWEIDSFEHHSSPAAYEKTMTRRASAQGYGLVVVSHTPRAIRTQPEVVIADLQRAYQLALQRPRPNVRAVDPGQMSHLAS
ncbi:hypothetical protein C5142_15605 [Rhodococcus sp. BGS-1C]